MNHLPRAHRTRPRGFTLFEMLVSAGLVLLLVTAMSAFLSDAMRIRARVSDEVARGRAAEAVLSAVERALETTVVEDAAVGTGIEGTSASISILRSGVSTWRLGTSEPHRAMEEIDRVRVVFDDEAGTVAIGRGERELSVIPGQLYRIRFRYFDGERWHSRFDSVDAGRLPAAVEIAVWYDAPSGEPVAAERPEFDSVDDELHDELADELDGGVPPDRVRIVSIPDAAPHAGTSP
ncbi:MAG: hypothetical protein SGJ11_17965 [Phycisphaerae bacterium]|nr:hypothetical protein [Phycisphaerae bacterium]